MIDIINDITEDRSGKLSMIIIIIDIACDGGKLDMRDFQ